MRTFMASDIEQTLIERVKSLPPEQQREVLSFLERLTPTPAADKTVWEEIDEVVESSPEETWQSVPADGASQLDHYFYGTPKK
jgi:hypothetical protein